VVLLFGTKRLKNIGGDLGSAIKGFKKAMSEGDATPEAPPQVPRVIENRSETGGVNQTSTPGTSKDQNGLKP